MECPDFLENYLPSIKKYELVQNTHNLLYQCIFKLNKKYTKTTVLRG